MPVTARLWLWAAILRPVKHLVPLGTLVRLVHRAPGPRNATRAQQVENALKLYRARAVAPSRQLPGTKPGAYRMLCAAGAAPQIVVGIRRGAGTRVDGHVWVVVDGHALAEDEAFIASYSRVLAFDADGCQVTRRSGRSAARHPVVVTTGSSGVRRPEYDGTTSRQRCQGIGRLLRRPRRGQRSASPLEP